MDTKTCQSCESYNFVQICAMCENFICKYCCVLCDYCESCICYYCEKDNGNKCINCKEIIKIINLKLE